ncbi:MAG TPA: ATP-binding cassette domain-containing protein [Thermoanaerobaculia bacterium]|jgi:ABC-2 type transport system ATP-binding protein|nr:ATP-binding cassette domain-containing protein [Thermoanaerobaculia bacterium]
MEPILEVRDVRKSYDDFVAVGGVSMSVPPGSIFGLLGPNGAGKTSTIRMIMNITAPDSGEIRVFGHPRTSDDLRRIGYLPEERGLYRKMTVMDQLLFLGEIRGLKRAQLVPEVERWLARVELTPWTKKKIEELSKGMQQKVQLIGTVLHKPDLLILDEPFSGLDPINQELFRELLQDYRSQGKSVVLSTHGMELAERMCDHICLISSGRAVLDGELREIKRRVGGNSFRLLAEGDLERLKTMPEVEQATIQNGEVKLMLRPDADGAEALRQMVGFLKVREFRSEEPELEQIFMKAVRDAA